MHKEAGVIAEVCAKSNCKLDIHLAHAGDHTHATQLPHGLSVTLGLDKLLSFLGRLKPLVFPSPGILNILFSSVFPKFPHSKEASSQEPVRMPIDFQLSQAESAGRSAAAWFAQHKLKPARAEYLKHTGQDKRFQAQQELYRTTVENGLVKSQIVPSLGGTGGSLIEAVLMIEVGSTCTPL